MESDRPLPSQAKVVGLVATFRRHQCLQRLLVALKLQTLPPVRVLVVDNGDCAETLRVCEEAGLEVEYLTSPANLGCGDGLRQAECRLLEWQGEWTHAWILDDDVVPGPDAASRLVEALEVSATGLAAPLLIDAQGQMWAFPEPCDKAQRASIRESVDPGRVWHVFGSTPRRCCWATGACQMVTRKALEQVGPHRADFWLLGEDLEFSMRIASQCGACFIADQHVPHVPPAPADEAQATLAGYRKFLSLLQNLSYLGFRCPHSFHMWRYVPGNFKRFFLTEGVTFKTVRDAMGCFWRGAVVGRPFGFRVGEPR
ncbi:MAG: glycosyltransferase family 2 protein [Candidatus Methylacidiphilales bacterium]